MTEDERKEYHRQLSSSGGKARWKGKTKKERSAYGKMMAEKRYEKDIKSLRE